MKSEIGVILLAAGESRRLDFVPKQLLKFRGKTLIRLAVETALNAGFTNICVVLGANSGKIRAEIEDFNVKIAVNENWQIGQGASLKKGLKSILEIEKNTSAVIVQLCDQPLILPEHFKKLSEIYQATNAEIVAAAYENTLGVPALFSSVMFAELFDLPDDKGAKSLILKHLEKTTKVAIPEAVFDIDTRQDYERLLLADETSISE